MTHRNRTHLHAILVLLAIGAAACERGKETAPVARAEDHEFTVAEAVRLLAPELGIPNRPEVVMALADLWIDYTLLAIAVTGDSSLAHLDLQPLIAQQDEIEMIAALRDSVIQPDTAISEEELRIRFAQDAPGVRVRARHILLTPPEQATAAQRDSVRALAEELLSRLRAGAQFETLATEYSQDPGSAAQGGDLGFFEHGQMLAAFDSAAFALEPSELSDVVATPFGLHIIKVEEKETPGFEDLAEQFRQQLQGERMIRAESLYVAGVEERAQLELVEGAAEMVREVARNPMAGLSGRVLRRALVRYEGGSLTVDELRVFMQTRQPAYRQQVQQASDQQIVDNVLKALAQRELLVAEARRSGIEANQARQDSMAELVRTSFQDSSRELGLLSIAPNAGESRSEAIDRTVEALLQAILRGEQDVLPMGAMAFTLRQQYSEEVVEPSVAQVVRRVEAARGPGAMVPPGQPSSPAQEPPTDSASAPSGGAG